MKRANARWMEGAPAGVLSCHKDPSKNAPADSFTVYFKTDDPRRADYLSMSALPFHPQGICCSGECEGWQRARFMRSYAGRKIRWLDLPKDCQTAARKFAEAT